MILDKTIFCDIDNTLAIWGKDGVEFAHPHGHYKGLKARLNETVEKELRQFKSQGYGIIFWSRGGGKYAAAMAASLGVEDLYDVCQGKPSRYYDDEHCTVFLEDHKWAKP